MNMVDIVSPAPDPATPPTPRSTTAASPAPMPTASEKPSGGSREMDSLLEYARLSGKPGGTKRKAVDKQKAEDSSGSAESAIDEKTPLLDPTQGRDVSRSTRQSQSRLWQIPKRIADAILYGASVVFTTLAAPGRYVIACFYDDAGRFSAILPLKSFRDLLSRRRRKSTAQVVGLSNAPEGDMSNEKPSQKRTSIQRSPSVDSNAPSTSTASSDAETEAEKNRDSPSRRTRSKTASTTSTPGTTTDQQPQDNDITPHRKSGRVKLQHNDEALRKRKAARAAAAKQRAAHPDDLAAVASTLKSPSSPSAAGKLTRYPRAPAPPRPLVPRRQPSYTLAYATDLPRKTLIIDLDETLIHSMAKGGRMSTGHMVEVRLGGNYGNTSPVTTTAPTSSNAGGAGGAAPAFSPGVPILYYVHERPACHDFLSKVAKWYQLVVFTASVQEYADPVIDWLERERKYFSGRYYRQHCTLRNGAYIKDLAQVEPDLSRVMILDNSPMSYIFHEDNAIPIEGWISDPTDNDLLHLVPLLEGLQYVTDVRALLALRQGQAQQG